MSFALVHSKHGTKKTYHNVPPPLTYERRPFRASTSNASIRGNSSMTSSEMGTNIYYHNVPPPLKYEQRPLQASKSNAIFRENSSMSSASTAANKDYQNLPSPLTCEQLSFQASAPNGSFGENFVKPPLFNGSNYPHWKAQMKPYLQWMSFEVWGLLNEELLLPKPENGTDFTYKEFSQFTDDQKHLVTLNCMALRVLLSALTPKIYGLVSSLTMASEVWMHLEVLFEGNARVSQFRKDLLVGEFKQFQMKEGESLDDILSRFSILVSKLKNQGVEFGEKILVENLL